MRSGTWCGVAVATLAIGCAWTTASASGQVQGCVALNPGAPSCTHAMLGDGAYAASGSWRITVRRGASTVVLEPPSAPAVGAPGTIRAGDVVSAEALAPGSVVAVSRTVSFGGGASVGCVSGHYDAGGPATAAEPDDPLLASQWGLRQIRASGAWRRSRGGGATIAVVDTGVDLQHPDLAGKLARGADLWETRPGGAPDCPGPDDEQFHGTAVAGVIAAEADNGVGIAGVAPAARILPVRVRDHVDSPDFSRVAEGIRWAADHGADVISLTGGVGVPLRPSPVIEEEIAEAAAYAWDAGALIVATAGNLSAPWCQYPAAAPHVVCAAATTPAGKPAQYSQFPFRLDGGVAVRAPGGARTGGCDHPDDVVSATPPASAIDGCGPAGYGHDSGTTYATAHVAGVAALLAARKLGNAAIAECLRSTSSNRGAWDPIMGYGIVDAQRAVRRCTAGGVR